MIWRRYCSWTWWRHVQIFFFLVCRRLQIHYISSLLCFWLHILPFSLFFILILIWRRYYSWTWWRHFVHIYIYIFNFFFGLQKTSNSLYFSQCTLLSLISHSLVTTWEPWFLHFFQIFFFFCFTEEFRFIIFLPFSVFYSTFFPSLCFLF